MSVTSGALIRTVMLFDPVTLYFATFVAPLQVTLDAPQLNTPARLILIVAPVQLPVPRTIVPRSISWSHLIVSGFTTLALTDATCVAARAGAAPSRAQAIAAVATTWR